MRHMKTTESALRGSCRCSSATWPMNKNLTFWLAKYALALFRTRSPRPGGDVRLQVPLTASFPLASAALTLRDRLIILVFLTQLARSILQPHIPRLRDSLIRSRKLHSLGLIAVATSGTSSPSGPPVPPFHSTPSRSSTSIRKQQRLVAHSGCLQLQPAAATASRWTVSHLHMVKQRLAAHTHNQHKSGSGRRPTRR